MTRAIIGFRQSISEQQLREQLVQLPASVTVVGTIPQLGLATVQGESYGNISAAAAQLADVEFVERDHASPPLEPVAQRPLAEAAQSSSKDTKSDRYAEQPRLKEIGVPEAIQTVRENVETPRKVLVAHADGGIEYTHPELAPTYVAGRDFVADDRRALPGPRYPKHGVKTGSLFGSDPDTERIAGVTPYAVALACQVYGKDLGGGSGLVSHIVDMIAYGVEQGAKVLLLVVQPRRDSKALKRAVDHAVESDVLLVASAGNFSWDDQLTYPAQYDEVLAVGASTPNGERANFSNKGPNLDLYAPGTEVTVLAPTDDGYQLTRTQGTSFSGPIVGGVSTHLYAADYSLSADDVEQILKDTADPGPDGVGIVNAKAAVDSVV